jgi:diguanylate cyclase (GGDEF)-like protein
VILLDVQMPELDGYQTARMIKARERTRHVPIIFLTAVDNDDHAERRGYDAGAVDYLFKPFDPTVLRSKVGVFIDLHHLKREADELAHRALHDPLTGLANRVLFRDRLEHALAHIGRLPSSVGVFYIDLDGFKPINDSMGHETGDALLVELAARLRQTVRSADTVARLGGDEFAIVSDTLEPPGATTVAERLLEAINAPFDLPGGSAHVSASIGVALAEAAMCADTLVRAADEAMYAAKALGGRRWMLHDMAPRRTPADIDVVLLPRIDIDSATFAGWGVEVRDERGEPIAIDRLDADAAARVLELAVGRADGAPVSVPVPRSLLRDPLAAVRRARALAGGADAPLCVELAAGELANPPARMVAALQELGRTGVALAVRGAGTGAASPATLAGLPLSTLVLDAGLDAATMRGVAALAHALELRVVAPGVEDEDDLERARELGCDIAEGTITEAVATRSGRGR